MASLSAYEMEEFIVFQLYLVLRNHAAEHLAQQEYVADKKRVASLILDAKVPKPDDEYVCPICINEQSRARCFVKMCSCSHVLHKMCAQRLFKSELTKPGECITCPVCRAAQRV